MIDWAHLVEGEALARIRRAHRAGAIAAWREISGVRSPA
jgi:hypothetical protein